MLRNLLPQPNRLPIRPLRDLLGFRFGCFGFANLFSADEELAEPTQRPGGREPLKEGWRKYIETSFACLWYLSASPRGSTYSLSLRYRVTSSLSVPTGHCVSTVNIHRLDVPPTVGTSRRCLRCCHLDLSLRYRSRSTSPRLRLGEGNVFSLRSNPFP